MVVMEILGQGTISLTMNTYSHVIPALHQEAADRIDGCFAEPPSGGRVPEGEARSLTFDPTTEAAGGTPACARPLASIECYGPGCQIGCKLPIEPVCGTGSAP